MHPSIENLCYRTPMAEKFDGAGSARARRWQLAFERWLAQRGATVSQNVVAIDRRAVEKLLAFCGKPPWRVTRPQVEAYLSHLAERGLADKTIRAHLGALKRFYAFCSQERVDPWLHRVGRSGFYPTNGVEWAGRDPGEYVFYLNEAEEERLLETLRQDGSPMGKRDYALILCLLRTGWKVEKARNLTVAGVLRDKASRAGRPANGEEGNRDEVTEEVREAVFEWLGAAGRLGTLQKGDHVFATSRNPVRYEASDNPADWDPSRPPISDYINRIIHRYAGYAGLRAERVNARTLRNTRARRMLEAGRPPEEIARALGIRSIRQIQIYINQVARASSAGFAPEENREWYWSGSHAPQYFQPGHRKSLVHGLYARRLLPEVEAMQAAGELDGGHPLKALVAHYELAIARACALMEAESTPASERVKIASGLDRALSKLQRARSALRLADQANDPDGGGPEAEPAWLKFGSAGKTGRRRGRSSPGLYPKLSERERWRRYNEAHHRPAGRRRSRPKRRSAGYTETPAHKRSVRKYRRPEPENEPVYHVDFFNEGEED